MVSDNKLFFLQTLLPNLRMISDFLISPAWKLFVNDIFTFFIIKNTFQPFDRFRFLM